MRAAVLLGLALLVTGTGCGSNPDPDEAADEATASRDAVVDALRGAASSAAGVGELGEATGSYAVCGSPPAEAVEYRASVRVRAGDQQATAVTALTDRLADDGWTVVDEGGDPQPWSNVERDDLTGSVRVDPMQGSDALVLAVAGPCVSVAEGQTSSFELSKEPLDLT